MHPCEIIYNANKKNYGYTKGICRITGKASSGVLFSKWVKKTFNDYDCLLPGSIISNEALFCFDESSLIIAQKAKKEKPQRFRNYSHVVINSEWFIFSKAQKKEIFEIILKKPEIVCIADSGQKHILFKHKMGFWQFENTFIIPNIDKLKYIHSLINELYNSGFSQKEIYTGNFYLKRIENYGLEKWKQMNDKIEPFRKTKMFDFASFFYFKN